MARLTADMITALSATVVTTEFLLELDYVTEPVRIWTGVRDLVWSGSTWNAAGTFQGIGEVEETSELRAVGTSISISGIPAAYITTALSENYRNRDITLRLACLYSSDNSVVADPAIIFKGKIDQQTIMEQGETAVITLNAESNLIDLGRTRRLLFTHEDQQLYAAGDKGCEYVASLANETMTWGI